MKSREPLKAVFLSLTDTIKNNYTYHSGALTYHFMLSIAPLTVVLIHLLSFLPFFGIDKIELLLDRFFPQYTSQVIHEIIRLQHKGFQGSFLALGVSYVFSVGFLKNMSRAFSYVSGNILGGRNELFYWFLMPILMLVFIIILSAFFLLSVYLKVVLPRPLSVISELSYILPGTAILFFLYLSFLKKRVSLKTILITSLFVSMLMFFLQMLFTWYLAKVFKGSLLYGSLSTAVAFLLWINLIFLSMLSGARLIYRLENP